MCIEHKHELITALSARMIKVCPSDLCGQKGFGFSHMNKKKLIAIILTVFLAFLSVVSGVYYGKVAHMTSLDSNIKQLLDKPSMEGKLNLLLLGVDEDGTRSDTIMVVSVDNVKKDIKLLSIPRDTKITLNNGKVMKINAGMGMKNPEEFMIETIKTITKMPIHYYCEINFDGFKEIIDILGGIDYDVPYDMDYDDPAQNLHIHLKAGMQHLNGQAAHDFVRFRHNNKGADIYAPGDYSKGDIGRISAQQDFLSELFRQKIQPQYILKTPELINAAYKYVQTNFTVKTAMEFVSVLISTETTELDTFLLPGTAKYENKISYYIYSPSQTKTLILEEFGYPEDEAKQLEKSNSEKSSAPSATPSSKTADSDETYSESEISTSPSSIPSRQPATLID